MCLLTKNHIIMPDITASTIAIKSKGHSITTPSTIANSEVLHTSPCNVINAAPFVGIKIFAATPEKKNRF